MILSPLLCLLKRPLALSREVVIMSEFLKFDECGLGESNFHLMRGKKITPPFQRAKTL